MHGTRMLSWSEIRNTYGRELVVLKHDRWQFLNTLFSVSEAVMYMQVCSESPNPKPKSQPPSLLTLPRCKSGCANKPLLQIRNLFPDRERGLGHIDKLQCGATWQCLSAESACLPQMVDRLDQGALPLTVAAQTYPALHALVAKALFRTHVEGKLKAGCPYACPLSGLLHSVSWRMQCNGVCERGQSLNSECRVIPQAISPGQNSWDTVCAGGDHPGPSKVRGAGPGHGTHAPRPAGSGERLAICFPRTAACAESWAEGCAD